MKKIIGVCVTRVHGELCRAFLQSLYEKLNGCGYRLCVFQSVYDFDEEDVTGSAAVFDAIPYKRLSALVMLHDTIYSNTIVNRIIQRARQNKVPVIMARKAYDGCYCLVGDYETPYAHLIRRVVTERDIKDVFYIAGRKKSGSDSKGRLSVFSSVMKELGIPFDDTKVGYGEYYEVPTRRIIDDLLSGGKRPPQGIFCANDIMALAAMERLKSYGYRVPEDCVVTGFDGLESAKYSNPRLSTCFENLDTISKLILEVLKEIESGNSQPKEITYAYEPLFAETTGHTIIDSRTNTLGLDIFRRFRMDEADEDANNSWLDRLMKTMDLKGLIEILPEQLEKGRCIAYRQDPYYKMVDTSEGNRLPAAITLCSYSENGERTMEELSPLTCISAMMDYMPEDKVAYFSAISLGNVVFGFSCDTTSDPVNDGGRINRYAFSLNRGFTLAMNGEHQISLADQINKSRYLDPLTGMLNVDGANHWYHDFRKSVGETDSLCVGVYTLINSKKLSDEYGVEFMEEVLQFLGNTLALANPNKEMLARISGDTFAVASLVKEEDAVKNAFVVDDTIRIFYEYLEIRKKGSSKWEYVEVSCGYADGLPSAYEGFENYMDVALSALYKNRAAFDKNLPSGIDRNDGTAILEYRRKFMTLIHENLFKYNFQPIVDAHTGEIVAYEALMRSSGAVDLKPLEILGAADMYGKLHDVEFLTLDNIFKRIQANPEGFGDRKVFINTIPGYFLEDYELELFREKYGEILGKAVIEITETQTIDDLELEKIRCFRGDEYLTPVAVDDYGTGHSNIVNLLEYKPQVVKIDHYLISNIQSDKNKQMFVKNLLEFAVQNDIKVLAEGVETAEELETVISYGVDLIQGFYTGRPSEEPLAFISDEIRNEILRVNKKYHR